MWKCTFREEKVDALDLVEWEQSGMSLATRLEKAWIQRMSIKERTMMDMLGNKADSSIVRRIQACVLDLDLRLAQLARTAEGSAADLAAAFAPRQAPHAGVADPWLRTLREDSRVPAPG